MTYNDLMAFFSGLTNTAKVLGIKNKQTVHAWKGRKRIPSRWQLKAAALSGGRLRADPKAREVAAELAVYVNGDRR